MHICLKYSIKENKTSVNIGINHATLAGLDAQRTVNKWLNIELFKSLETKADFHPVDAFEVLLKLEMEAALADLKITRTDIKKYNVKMMKMQHVKVSEIV